MEHQHMNDEVTLGLCIPSHDQWAAGFGCSLFHMAMALKRASGVHRVVFNNQQGSSYADVATDLVRWSLDAHCTHLLFLNADTVFPPWMAQRLLSHQVDVVAVDTPRRIFPVEQTACVNTPNGRKGIPSLVGDSLIEADRIGFGIVLIRAEVFRAVPEPWFLVTYDAGVYTSEDYYFSDKIRAAGFKIMVDPLATRWTGRQARHLFSYAQKDDGQPVSGAEFCPLVWSGGPEADKATAPGGNP
jgi:hypothetical protein